MVLREWTNEQVKELCQRYSLTYFSRHNQLVTCKNKPIISVRIGGQIRPEDIQRLEEYGIFI